MATFQHGAITTTATTADQVINTFTPTNTTSWKSTMVVAYLTTYSASESNLGKTQLQTAGTDRCELRLQNTDNDSCPGIVIIPWGDGITLDGATVMRWVTTPAAATSMRWTSSFFGEG